jgi:DNA-binding NarL/FixJ family response regulator
VGRTADAIAEGVAIATAAARLAVRNHILIGTIAEDGVFDMDKYVADAREALRAMAEESEAAETNLTALRKRARGRHSDPSGTHDYRDRDVRNLRRRGAPRVVVLTRRASRPELGILLQGGLRGVVAGSTAPSVQRAAVAAVPPPPLPDLTAREISVLKLVADGRTNRLIGEDLGLSALTVKSHLARISRKLGTGDRAELVAISIRGGVLA